tara:strand:+ start:1013 stop:1441 length:429 start_codon:yes stop_codon:yes gene_type:complete
MNFDITIWLSIALGVSFVVNVFMFWYLRKLLSKLMFVSENLNDLVEIVKNYRNHLKQVYNLEMFYGDETLKFLMSHTNSLLEILKEYEDVYDIAVPIELQGETEIDDQENNPNEDIEETDSEAPQESDKENVFYTRPRERNS